jgi:hypothetical protein
LYAFFFFPILSLNNWENSDIQSTHNTSALSISVKDKLDKNGNEYTGASEWANNDVWSTQCVPGGKVNSLRGHMNKVYMYMCPIPNSFRDTAISLHSSKTVDKKAITYCL